MNGKVLMLAIIFFGGFHVFYAFNRVQNFANIMYRLCAIQLGECLKQFNMKLSLKGKVQVLLLGVEPIGDPIGWPFCPQ